MLDRRLDAHLRLTDAEGRFFLARTEYEVALKNVYFEKGAIFDDYDLKEIDNGKHLQAPQPLPMLNLDTCKPATDRAASNG